MKWIACPEDIGLQLESKVLSHIEAEILTYTGYLVMAEGSHLEFQDGYYMVITLISHSMD